MAKEENQFAVLVKLNSHSITYSQNAFNTQMNSTTLTYLTANTLDTALGPNVDTTIQILKFINFINFQLQNNY